MKGPSCLFALPSVPAGAFACPAHHFGAFCLLLSEPVFPGLQGSLWAELRREISAGSVLVTSPCCLWAALPTEGKEQLQTFLWFCKQGKLLCSSIWRAEPGLVLGAGAPTRIFYSAVGWQRAQERVTWAVAQAVCKSCEDFQPLHCPLIQLS